MAGKVEKQQECFVAANSVAPRLLRYCYERCENVAIFIFHSFNCLSSLDVVQKPLNMLLINRVYCLYLKH